jgi:hypothetical protein
LEDGRGELREGGGTVAHLITKLSLVIGTGGCGGTLDGECLVPRKVSIENLPKPTSPYLMLLVEVVCGPGEVIQRVALDTLGSIPRLSFLTCSPSKPMTGCIWNPEIRAWGLWALCGDQKHTIMGFSVDESMIRFKLSSSTNPEAGQEKGYYGQ